MEDLVSSGFVRKVDELGRIILPMDLRKSLNIKEKDSLEIFVDKEGRIVLQKYEPEAGGLDGLVEYKGVKYTRRTILELAELAGIDIVK